MAADKFGEENDQKRRKELILCRIRSKIEKREAKLKEQQERMKLKELPERYVRLDNQKLRCKRCKCVTSSVKAMNRHFRVKHDSACEIFECGNCGKSFTRHDNFLKHKKKFHSPPSPDLPYHKAFNKPKDDLAKPLKQPTSTESKNSKLSFKNYTDINDYINTMTTTRPEYVKRWEFESLAHSPNPQINIKNIAPIPKRVLRYENFLAPLCKKRKMEEAKKARETVSTTISAPPTLGLSPVHSPTYSPRTQEVIDELALSSSSDEEQDTVQQPILKIPESWNIPDELNLSEPSSDDAAADSDDDDLDKQAAALDKLMLNDTTPVGIRLVDYDLSDGDDADDEAEDDDDDDDDLFFITDEA